jgi:uncharacterized small protein (DUF1192 family)
MDLEDFEPRNPRPKAKDLGLYSVHELQEYISMLETEIARAKETIAKKQSHKNAAAQVFKS